ncbi:hypothetical protein VB712_19205 [Spirulina sp. CCNP1310]|uniref:hypothetical protein n=1 Tax=Spirulina sp. CCNP1310 TaxID=3110249 RepID=UPI002B200345|nr:hypothetical protein [Spirulina sp. CCNP1310]MEA5421358.1 hypothetical protein [Spirulina sp. CCNP1310]
MKLVLTKNQTKGMMGNVSFEVKASVKLSAEESSLIDHYKLRDTILFSKKMVFLGQIMDQEVQVRVRDLLSGEAYKCKDLSEVIGYSDSIKSACETLKAYLLVARNFGGEEIIEIQ